MKKLKLNLDIQKELLTKEQMRKISGGSGNCPAVLGVSHSGLHSTGCSRLVGYTGCWCAGAQWGCVAADPFFGQNQCDLACGCF